MRIRLSKKTVKVLRKCLQRPWRDGDVRVVRRIAGLWCLAQAQSIEEAPAFCSVCTDTIRNWLKAFLLYGTDSLVYKRSPGPKPRLTKTQREELKNLILAGPISAAYPTGCWTPVLIQDLIYQRFGVLYNRHYVCSLLRNLGFSFQKAKFVSDHLDNERREVWMEDKWPKIRQEAIRKGALLLFVDEASFPQWGSLSYTWAPVGCQPAPVGCQPAVKTSGKRKGCKVFGAMDFFSRRLFYNGTIERFNSDTYQEFLSKILKQTSRPIILIQDGARYYTSKSTKEFFSNRRDTLTVYQLPSYSPDCNPIEYLWKNIKRRSTHSKYFAELDLLINSVEEALVYYSLHPQEVRGVGRIRPSRGVSPRCG